MYAHSAVDAVSERSFGGFLKRGLFRGLLFGAMLLGSCGFPSTTWAGWVGIGESLNSDSTRSAWLTGVVDVGGEPYVGLSQSNAIGPQVRVVRLNTTGTSFEPVGAALSDTTSYSDGPVLASVGDRPYAAWSTASATTWSIHAARLGSDDASWQSVGGTFSPIPGKNATDMRLDSRGGVVRMAWMLSTPGPVNSNEIHVARLSNDATSWDPEGGVLSTESAVPVTPRISGSYVAWLQEAVGNRWDVRAARWNEPAAAWEFVGDPMDAGSRAVGIAGLSIVVAGGRPYLAWNTRAETPWSDELHVVRLDATGTTWEDVSEGLDAPAGTGAYSPELAAAGDVPYIAWKEATASSARIYVARRPAGAPTWERLGSDVGSGNSADSPQLAAFGGVPLVAYTRPDAVRQGRVAWLAPDVLAQASLATDTDALLVTRLRTRGLSYRVRFQYGQGSALDHETSEVLTEPGVSIETIFATAQGLTAGLLHSWRAVASSLELPARAFGPTQSMRTRLANGPGVAGSQGSAGAAGPAGAQGSPGLTGPQGLRGPPGRDARVTCKAGIVKKRVRLTCTVRLVSSTPKATVTARLIRDGITVASARARSRPGAMAIHLHNSRTIEPGRYTLTVTFVDAHRQAHVLAKSVRVRAAPRSR